MSIKFVSLLQLSAKSQYLKMFKHSSIPVFAKYGIGQRNILSKVPSETLLRMPEATHEILAHILINITINNII
jgi:hypothetical protein